MTYDRPGHCSLRNVTRSVIPSIILYIGLHQIRSLYYNLKAATILLTRVSLVIIILQLQRHYKKSWVLALGAQRSQTNQRLKHIVVVTYQSSRGRELARAASKHGEWWPQEEGGGHDDDAAASSAADGGSDGRCHGRPHTAAAAGGWGYHPGHILKHHGEGIICQSAGSNLYWKLLFYSVRHVSPWLPMH